MSNYNFWIYMMLIWQITLSVSLRCTQFYLTRITEVNSLLGNNLFHQVLYVKAFFWGWTKCSPFMAEVKTI